MRKPSMNRKQVEAVMETILSGTGAELVDLEYHREAGGQMLRCFIDYADGVGLDTCQRISRHIMNVLEEKDLIPYDYLEVSSPGTNRIIKKDKDFLRFTGELVKIRTLEARDGQRNFTGILTAFDDENIVIEIPDMEGEDKTVTLPRSTISTVRLHPEL